MNGIKKHVKEGRICQERLNRQESNRTAKPIHKKNRQTRKRIGQDRQ